MHEEITFIFSFFLVGTNIFWFTEWFWNSLIRIFFFPITFKLFSTKKDTNSYITHYLNNLYIIRFERKFLFFLVKCILLRIVYNWIEEIIYIVVTLFSISSLLCFNGRQIKHLMHGTGFIDFNSQLFDLRTID